MCELKFNSRIVGFIVGKLWGWEDRKYDVWRRVYFISRRFIRFFFREFLDCFFLIRVFSCLVAVLFWGRR